MVKVIRELVQAALRSMRYFERTGEGRYYNRGESYTFWAVQRFSAAVLSFTARIASDDISEPDIETVVISGR